MRGLIDEESGTSTVLKEMREIVTGSVMFAAVAALYSPVHLPASCARALFVRPREDSLP